jgi:putative heme-binding domain-containing protein
MQGETPAGWRALTHNGEAKFTVDSTAKSGARSAKIASQEGGDVSWSQDVTVKPNTRYRLTAWVKAKGVDDRAMGALFNVHQLQKEGLPRPLKGDADWTQLTGEFATEERSSVTINMLFGGWGRSTGEAWYDDVQLIELGPGGAGGAPSLASSSGGGGAGGAGGKLAQVVAIVTRHYADRAPIDSIVVTLEALKSAEPELAESVLDGLVASWPEGADKPPALADADKARLAALGEALPADRLLVLAARWGQSDIFAGQMEAVLKTVQAALSSPDTAASERADAARRMLRLRDDGATVTQILAQVTPQASNELARLLIQSLADSRVDGAGEQIVAAWRNFTPDARAAAVGVMLRRAPWTRAMLKGIADKKLARSDLTASDWQVLKSHRERDIARLAGQLDTTTTNPDRLKVLEAMLPALEGKGDLAVGQKLFTQLCVQCHAHNGQGGKIGPELTGIGSRDPKEILAEIVDPNRSVEANYRMWDIETRSRDHFSGRLNAETQTTVELLDATGKTHVIQRKDIRSMNISALSVMPVGLVDTLKHEEVSSLLEYLKTGHAPAAN